jgi:hypothetical protein
MIYSSNLLQCDAPAEIARRRNSCNGDQLRRDDIIIGNRKWFNAVKASILINSKKPKKYGR